MLVCESGKEGEWKSYKRIYYHMLSFHRTTVVVTFCDHPLLSLSLFLFLSFALFISPPPTRLNHPFSFSFASFLMVQTVWCGGISEVDFMLVSCKSISHKDLWLNVNATECVVITNLFVYVCVLLELDVSLTIGKQKRWFRMRAMTLFDWKATRNKKTFADIWTYCHHMEYKCNVNGFCYGEGFVVGPNNER